jgi:hypothetical protein
MTTIMITTINMPVLTPALKIPPTISQEGRKITMSRKEMILNRVGFLIFINIRGITYKVKGLLTHSLT